MNKNITARERVKAALQFTSPDRAPREIWALPGVQYFQKEELEEFQRQYPMDIGSSQLAPGWNWNVIEASANAQHYKDEWGSVWYVGEAGVIGEVKEPALADWSKLPSFQPPWDLLKNRDFDVVNRKCAQSDLFMLSECTSRPFERLQFLCGSEKVYLDIGYGTRELRQLLEMIHDYYLKDIAWWCRTDVDGIMFMDDWGTNRSLLISPKTWRELFKPLYKEYCDMMHKAGKFAFFHTDGNTQSVFGDFVEVGIDAVNSQLFCMDIEELARNYKGKITFWGEIDRQYALPFGTPDEVRDAVMRVRRVLDDGKGGLIAQCEWGKGNSRANIEAVYKAWMEPRPAEGASM